jgi:cytochrome c-type biogenesis protein CcmH/NrfF
MLSELRSDGQIIELTVARYGDLVLYDLPLTGRTAYFGWAWQCCCWLVASIVASRRHPRPASLNKLSDREQRRFAGPLRDADPSIERGI